MEALNSITQRLPQTCVLYLELSAFRAPEALRREVPEPQAPPPTGAAPACQRPPSGPSPDADVPGAVQVQLFSASGSRKPCWSHPTVRLTPTHQSRQEGPVKRRKAVWTLQASAWAGLADREESRGVRRLSLHLRNGSPPPSHWPPESQEQVPHRQDPQASCASPQLQGAER